MVELKVLQDVGLSEIEAKVYLACLELGVDSVLQISKKANVKRPTTYVTLDNLVKQGFVSKIEKEHTTLYAAEEPKIILNKYKERLENLSEMIPFLSTKLSKGNKPRIRVYEGVEAISDVYTKILSPLPTRELYYFGTDVEPYLKDFTSAFSEFDRRYYKEKQFTQTFEIVNNNLAGIEYARKYGTTRNIRLVPKGFPATAETAFNETKLFLTSLKNNFGILIESEDLVLTYKSFFMMAWQMAEEVK